MLARARRCLTAPLLAIAVAASPAVALAQPKPPPAAASDAGAPAPEPEAAVDSPRASVKRYLELCRAGEHAEAAAYLDLADGGKAQGPELARRLKAVLDRQIWVKLDTISPQSLGNLSDGLPAGVDEIGNVPGPMGTEPVRLVRRRTADGWRWLFSRSTVEHVDGWYALIRDRWVQEYLPQPLLRAGPRDLLYWQWIALPLLFAAAIVAGNVLGYFTRLALGRLAARTKATWDDALLAKLGAPFTFAWAIAAVYFALPWIALYPPAEAFIFSILKAAVLIAVFWFALRGIDVSRDRVIEVTDKRGNAEARSLVPLGAKGLKVAVFAMAVIAVLSQLGYPVATLIAGLGIGGVALALAAQKTVENLFGSISIGVDQPFRLGDFINVDTISGTVESIGLRSTRIRTADRTLITIPNGKLADMRIESFSGRDRIRFATVLGLSRRTPSPAVRAVLEQTRTLLKEHPKAWSDVSVALVKIGESSLDVEISAWFKTVSSEEFSQLREEMLLELLAIVERAGAELAYPTRSVRLEGQ